MPIGRMFPKNEFIPFEFPFLQSIIPFYELYRISVAFNETAISKTITRIIQNSGS